MNISNPTSGTTKNVSKSKNNTLMNAKTRDLTLMTVPGILLFIIFNYLPMAGLVLAFKDFRYDKGIFGSPWVGFENFKFFFTSEDAWRVTRNTIGYNLVFIITIIVGALVLAIMLNEVKRRRAVKFYQTVLFFPYFLSWAVVAFMTYALFNVDLGIINQLLVSMGKDPIMWYANPKPWIVIMPLLNFWKTMGYNVILFYAGIMAIDQSYYESAAIDGASKLQMATKITMPLLTPTIVILVLIKVGKIFYSDFGQFFMVPRESGILFSTTDVIDTYVFRALKVSGEIGMASAVGLYQSFVGLVLVLFTNWVIKKFSEENALF